jgi:beta-D-xylosidase 4
LAGDAVANVVSPHRYVKTAEEAVAVTLSSGMDVDCSYFVGQHGMKAYQMGLINDKLIDTRLANLFRVRMRLQHFDPPGPLQKIPTSAICTKETAAIARDGVVQSAALLKNLPGTLPLSAKEIKTAAVIGPTANLSHAMAKYYGPGAVCDNAFPTVIDAVRSYVPHAAVSYLAGVPSVLSDDTANVSQAASLAQSSDVVVLVLGTDLSVACENRDAVNITFSDGQLALVKEVSAAAKKPVIVVTLTAVPLDLTPLLNNSKVGAILHVGQPSIQTMGIADLLFGTTSPAGRMVQTVYPASYQNMVSPFDFNMRPGPSRWPRPDCPGPCTDPMVAPIVPNVNCTLGTNPGRTHRFFIHKAVVPFGFGLSYTTFKYAMVSAPDRQVSLRSVRTMLDKSTSETVRQFPSHKAMKLLDAPVQYTINVTNTGAMDAAHVVLGTLTPPDAGVDGIPLQTLWGFERVFVKAGRTVTVDMYPSMTDFTHVDEYGVRDVHTGTYTFRFGVKDMPLDQGFLQHTFHAY